MCLAGTSTKHARRRSLDLPMFSLFLMPICGLVLYLMVSAAGEARSRVWTLLLVGYVFRLAFQYIVRTVPFFSHAVGGDSEAYELLAELVEQRWTHSGIHFVTADEVWGVGQAALPVNLFALVQLANGGPAREGCTAIVALAACATGLNVYKLAIELGVPEKYAYRTTAAFCWMPAFVLYTSDIYKDGLVLFFMLGALGSTIRLVRRFSLLHTTIGLLSLWALWYVRTYLVFATVAPLVVGVAGLNSKSLARPLIVTVAIAAASLAVATYSNVLQGAVGTATDTFNLGTSWRVLKYAEYGGSGIQFDDGGSIYGALHIKILYTVFAPFPWQMGSFGLHVGKIDSLIGTYFFYRSIVAIRRHWRTDKGLILALLVFIVPMTVVYALGVYNIGLILRQRMPVVTMMLLLGALSWKKTPEEAREEEDEGDEDEAEGEEDEEGPEADVADSAVGSPMYEDFPRVRRRTTAD